MGDVWNNIVKKCALGATKGLVGTASTDLTARLLMKGGTKLVAWQGYAALAVGGCIVDILF